MQNVSQLYTDIVAGDHWFETRVSIGETGVLLTNSGESLTFGGVRILVGASGADAGFDESHLFSVKSVSRTFSQGVPSVGSCVSSTLTLTMRKPTAEFERQGRIVPYVRACNDTQVSEWIQKGVYYIDTRKTDDSTEIKKVTITAYDGMMKAEQDYPASSLSWPAKDTDVVKEIAAFMGVGVDERTWDIMTHAYPIPYQTEYTCREILGFIAAMYGGCFIMNDSGDLRLVTIYGIPAETRYLVTDGRQSITFGGDRILV